MNTKRAKVLRVDTSPIRVEFQRTDHRSLAKYFWGLPFILVLLFGSLKNDVEALSGSAYWSTLENSLLVGSLKENSSVLYPLFIVFALYTWLLLDKKAFPLNTAVNWYIVLMFYCAMRVMIFDLFFAAKIALNIIMVLYFHTYVTSLVCNKKTLPLSSRARSAYSVFY